MTTRQRMGWITAVVALVAAISGGFGYHYAFPDIEAQEAESETGGRRVHVVALEQASAYQRTTSYSGSVRAARQTAAAFQRGGMITAIHADEGAYVPEDAPLAELDHRVLDGQLKALTARLHQAESVLEELRAGPRSQTIRAAEASVDDLTQQLEAANLRVARARKLIASQSISEQDFEQQLFEQRALEARLKSAQSQLDELNAGTRTEQIAAQEQLVKSLQAEQETLHHQLNDCTLLAPFSGTVVSRLLDPGAVVTAGTPVMTVISDRQLEVHMGLPASVADRLQPGATYPVIVGEQRTSAKLRTVLPALEPQTQTRRAVFDLISTGSDVPSPIVDGQLARIELADTVSESGFWVPFDALRSDHSGLWSCLTIKPDSNASDRSLTGVTVKQSVEVIHETEEAVFVRGSLTPGQWLVADGLHGLVAGQSVRAELMDWSAPPAPPESAPSNHSQSATSHDTAEVYTSQRNAAPPASLPPTAPNAAPGSDSLSRDDPRD